MTRSWIRPSKLASRLPSANYTANQDAYYKFYLFKLPKAKARADYLSATNPQRDPHAFWLSWRDSPLPSSDRMEWINAEQVNGRPQS